MGEGSIDMYRTKLLKKYYRWRIDDNAALDFLELIYPFLMGRKGEVGIAIEFQKYKSNLNRRKGLRYPACVKKRMGKYVKQLKELRDSKLPINSEQSVDTV